ncbi:hypothetical protein FRC06_011028 [Ceratobasidium sp. 370]|nr:hypothetical protein FRC06_011028 [Ceratobasidium sp. 370]
MAGLDPHSVKLSLEPPYRDDNGKPIPNLRDIGNDGTLIFEEKQSPSAALAPQLKRLHDLITSRKREFRTITEARVLADGAGIVDIALSPGLPHPTGVEMDTAPEEDGNEDGTREIAEEEQEQKSSTLNPESLMQLRADMIQRLEEARYSMSTSLDLLNCLLAVNSLSSNPTSTGAVNPTAGLAGLSSTPAAQTPPAPVTLAPSVLALPTIKPSVAVMNAQIGITTRDSGIRKAAAILRKAALSTAEEIERAGRGGGSGPSQGRYETSYWANSLRLRQACWALLPAPLPPGAGPALKGSTRISKDILFGFALEGSAVGYPSVIPVHAATGVKKQVPILGPVINLLRYRAMVQRVDSELKKVLSGLGRAGVQATLTMSRVSESAKAFVESLSRYVDTSGDTQLQPGSIQRPDQSLALSGEALLRIEDRHLTQITFHSPTLLKLHVVQAQITVHDHGQLGDFLRADVAARVVQYIQDIGKDFVAKSEPRGSEFSKSWFVDPVAGYCIGRWPSGKGRFQVIVRQNGSLHCEATVEFQSKPSTLVFDDAQGLTLKDWVCSAMALSPKLAA